MPTPSRRAAAALALLTGAGLLALSRLEPVATAAAETRHLALLATLALLGLAAMEPRLPGPIGALVLALAWWLPGTGRPAVILFLLVAAPLGVLAARASALAVRDAKRPAEDGAGAGPLVVDGFALVGLALALQVATRGQSLLDPAPEVLALEVFGPLVPVALAAGSLARRRGPGVVVGLLALALLGPGIGWVGGLTLAGLALAERRDGLRWGAPIVPWLSPAALGVGGSLAVGLALVRHGPGAWRIVPAALAALGGLAGFLALGAAPGPLLAWLPVLAVAFVAPGWTTAAGGGLLLCGLALFGVVHDPGPELLVPGLLLIAWTADRARRSPVATLWLALAWGGAGIVAAAYPWHRSHPLGSVGSLVPEPRVLWVVGLVGLAVLLDRRVASPSRAAPIALALVAVAVLGIPRTGELLLDEMPVVLSAAEPRLELDLPAGVAHLIVDTQLTHAQDLAAGSPVVGIWVRSPAGTVLQHRVLRNGVETGDWAAGRPGFRGSPPAATAWSHPVAGGGRFFATRYRARLELEPQPAGTRLEIRRVRRAPEETGIVVHRIEVRPGEGR